MENTHTVTIREIEHVTHDVIRFVTTKPSGYTFEPGQATEVAIALDGWKDEERPFTFTSLPGDPFLEFTIKIYPERDGVTDRMASLEIDQELLIGDPWGAIRYQGPGVFIAGGAGVTPFISILRDLQRRDEVADVQLHFSNETEDDVILAGEFRKMLGEDAHYVVSDEETEVYRSGRIDESYLREKISDFGQNFYLCGPPEMVEDIKESLIELGAAEDRVIHEEAA